MSLDVYLHGEEVVEECMCSKCLNYHEHRYKPSLFDANITHNLTGMADAAGIYRHLWRPEEMGIFRAKQLVEPLERGLDVLRADPEKFRTFNPENGWGSYEGLLRFVEDYLEACREHPEAEVYASR